VDSEEAAPLDVTWSIPGQRKNVRVRTWIMWERQSESISTQQALQADRQLTSACFYGLSGWVNDVFREEGGEEKVERERRRDEREGVRTVFIYWLGE
jgi:hypothetical protein